MPNARPPLTPGDPVPLFLARSTSGPRYSFHTVAGRYIVLAFVGSAGDRPTHAMLRAFASRKDIFDDDHAAFFGVTADPADEASGRLGQSLPGFRIFWDFELEIARLFGTTSPENPATTGPAHVRRASFVIDPDLRLLSVLPIDDPIAHATELTEFVAGLPRTESAEFASIAPVHAPVLVVPRIFEPDLCRRVIAGYERDGGTESGFMQEDAAGQTVEVVDHKYKRRRDCEVLDPELRTAIALRIERRLKPEISKVFQFDACRMERYIVSCYDATEGGYFRPHRDNTTKGTAHLRFAVTINLNAEEYDGGDLRFPEYGRRTFRAPTGGAVVFSCSLLHEATPVIRGRRYAFLPFLYDNAAARVRQANLGYLGDPALRETVAASIAPITDRDAGALTPQAEDPAP
jgi:peroxiredoxin